MLFFRPDYFVNAPRNASSRCRHSNSNNMKRLIPAAAVSLSMHKASTCLPSSTVTALPITSTLQIIHSSRLSMASSPVGMFYSSSTSTSNDSGIPATGTDNFSRYSKFLVKHSNGVDGMGQQRNEIEQDEAIVWMDNLWDSTMAMVKIMWTYSNTPKSHYQKRRIQRVALPLTQSPIQSLLSSSSHPHPWPKRLKRIIDILSHSRSDIICLQECEIQSFKDLVPALSTFGYDGIAQEDDRMDDAPTTIKEATRHRNPRNHIVATFWKRNKFEPVGPASVRTRSLTTVLRFRGEYGSDKDAVPTTTLHPTIAIVNVHLEGNPRRFSERTRQLQHALFDLANRMEQTRNNNNNMDKSTSSSTEDLTTLNGLILAGDFNCELQSSACSTYLRMGRLGRHAGLGGIHGEDAIVLPPSFLESTEATEVIHPIMEWGRPLPEEEMADIEPHPFRRNGMTSAYPKWLGKDNARSHFTFCSELSKRPVPGLDQIWFSSMTLKRTGLKRMFVNDSEVWERYFYNEAEMEKWREEERRKVLATGLPSLDCKYPSDHLPIGATFDWKWEECDDDSSLLLDGGKEVRRLTVVDSEGNNVQGKLVQNKPRVPQLEFENPEEELNYLLEYCPYDSEEQESDVKFILSPISPPLSLSFTSNETPTKDQMEQIEARHAKKVEVLSTASLAVRPWLKKIWKANKQVGKWNRHRLKHEARLGR
ncbi:hypothetical protein ACHAWU_009247 [Discostella pseudostelligera]|uniref:Endonuclease/exonuclease/phosphatase domain-containing protein n=1 Tax=Discostella pseudostelligera TaxID=259834 RepID=A0ABD3ND95_9STRA